MNRTVRQFSAMFGLGALALILGVSANAHAYTTLEDPLIDEIMKKVCSKKGAASKVKTAVEGEKWEDAQKEAKVMTDLGTKLGKNDPPKGDKENWAKLTKKFAADAKAVADAADKKDKDATLKAVTDFTNAKNCKNCHDNHK